MLESRFKKIVTCCCAIALMAIFTVPTFAANVQEHAESGMLPMANNKFHWSATIPRLSGETKIAHAGIKDPNGTDTTSVWLTEVDQGSGLVFNIRTYQSGPDHFGPTVAPEFTLLTGSSSTRRLNRHIDYNTVLELTGRNIDSTLVRVHAEGYCNFG